MPTELGGAGDPSPFTALGVQAAMRAASAAAFGTPDLAGRTVVVSGLGHVGEKLAHGLRDAGAKLIVSDVDPRKQAVADAHGYEWAEPEAALEADCDIVSPCAVGGAIQADNIDLLRCRAICGAANNQLADESLATTLAERGVVYAPDFIANAGGLINVYRELHAFGEERAKELALAIEGTMGRILARAERESMTPLEAARDLARERLDVLLTGCKTGVVAPEEKGVVDEASEIWIVRAGKLSYADGLALQERLAGARRNGEIPDVALLLEHWPVYTKGRRSEPGHLPMGEEWYRMQGIEVAETDRGGQVTYHGPGQLVAYPIFDLSALGGDVHAYVRALERAMIASLGAFGIPAQVFEGLTGVWTEGDPPISPGEIGPQRTPVGAGGLPGGEARKIGSIGIHVSGGITTHGLAVNVSNDLQPFEWIVPCAIDHVRMTSVGRELGREVPVDEFADVLRDQLAEALGSDPVDRELAELGAITA